MMSVYMSSILESNLAEFWGETAYDRGNGAQIGLDNQN